MKLIYVEFGGGIYQWNLKFECSNNEIWDWLQQMVEMECNRWASKGINIVYQIRETRGGYKAGALKEGLKRNYVKHCEYVAIFDADFRPEPDFLRRSIPFLVGNPDIALVQARWRFGK